MSSNAEREKIAAATEAVRSVRDGMKVGLGTGTTAAHAVRLLGERMRLGLRIEGIPTSRATETLAREVGIPLTDFAHAPRLDLTLDGADEVDGNLTLIKGGGGALLREKIVAAASDRVLILVDSAKVKRTLGAYPLPVEVVPFGHEVVAARIRSLGGEPSLRRDGLGRTFVTDEGHWLLDCAFREIRDPRRLSTALHDIPGVVEHGLFIDLAHAVFIGRDGGVDLLLRGPGPGAPSPGAR